MKNFQHRIHIEERLVLSFAKYVFFPRDIVKRFFFSVGGFVWLGVLCPYSVCYATIFAEWIFSSRLPYQSYYYSYYNIAAITHKKRRK